MKLLPIMLYLLCSVTTGMSQQRADTLFSPAISNPQYPAGKGPVILLDEGHQNFHTTTGRFRPFADFLRKDGYVVKGYTGSFKPDELKPARVVVIANALHESNLSEWTLPTPSAFPNSEISNLVLWVKNGGSLFLIADHMPFPGAAEKLAAVFGFTFYNGFAMNKKREEGAVDIFTLQQGLSDNVITRGRNEKEKITSLQTFTGQAFLAPPEATPIVVLDNRFELLLPQTAWEFAVNTTKKPAENLVQGAYRNYGKGRLVVFGEAAMFSAQIQRDSIRMGMNAKTAEQNPQFLLNLIHWLDRQLN
ncbi:MAG: hypothetical protein SH819_11520 [Cytophagales bacterium]|nr:hypothetical protein [Cytophagales bacterium]